VDPLEPRDPTLPHLDDHVVRRVPGYRADKTYVCPGCDNTLPPGVGHVVAWPQSLPDDRRHWHMHCWRIVARRGRL
jgi:hypothetical protein